MGAVSADGILGPGCTHQREGLVEQGTSAGEIDTQRVELGFEPTSGGAQDHPAAAHHVDRGQLLGQQHGLAHRNNQHGGADADTLGDGGGN